MNKIKHSLFRVISEIPSIRDSDKIAHLCKKCTKIKHESTDYQYKSVRKSFSEKVCNTSGKII